ncbi:Type IV fimbrial biogenesis protein PilY1 [Lysobacter dokdonensis DS-58]|uniref:Type IV fimbrial biogenesis protein PilY1 n=1 Tax=Lysobacter dokdonensis DS-58 TaxID=1300345 RepID=A0A0A2WJX3_9GAMM|nr:PilC/PilY family type IV pilus protein [Lysobacter dokdonensis]KGQ20481.1 Type IV fimbrial biogenesis protein PilY1 [Lysobacter dokdonensis DS-58]
MQTQTSSHARLWAVVAAFCATLISLPGAAVTIPDNPLQTGTAYPPPNILFILDDSGSMELTTMPDDPAATSGTDIAGLAYTRNGLSYNPNIDYKAWIKSDNTRLTGGMSYTAAYSDLSLASGSTISLADTDQIFYAPIPPTGTPAADYYDKAQNYKLYKIPAGGTTMLEGTYGTSNWANVDFFTAKTGLNAAATYTVTVTQPGMFSLNVATSGGSRSTPGRGVDLQLLNPSNAVVCNSTGNNNGEACSVANPTAGTWTIKLIRDSNFSNVTLTATWGRDNRCDTSRSDWTNNTAAFVNCVAGRPIVDRKDGTTPAARSLADELKNYAIWYSYYRTRMKTAKAGASEAFSRLSTNMRVGFDSIWGASRGYTNIRFRIPVGTNGGLFQGANRDTWFTQLQASDGSGNTPLHGALQRAGKYFQETGTTGPWGPESGANQISCRQNFALLTTDGYWNNQSGYTTAVGDSDSAQGPLHTSADLKNQLRYEPETPYIDNSTSARADTLADIANYYWKNDLRTLPNNVPKSTDDPAFWQHMTTFGVSIGLKGNLDPKTDLNGLVTGGKRWGNPLDREDEDRIDDLWHASLNGHGDFVVAKDPTEFARALVDALSTVEERDGSASNVTANTTSFIAGARIYQARYVSGKWTGELSAFDASEGGAAATAAWNGSEGIATSGRRVYTWTGTAGANFPTAAQITALNRTTGVAPINGTDNAAYVKGDRTKEIQNGGDQRNRSGVLGDIVNSSPMYVSDTNTIYVGANDGMLHAFDAGDVDTSTTTDGKELWAYVPGGISFTQLANYSDPQYAHRYFVDGSVIVSTRRQTPGQNILVGALGRGGKGLFSLDVTNPTTFGPTNAKWEIGGSDADMGQVLGDPLIVTLNDAAQTKAVLVSNGINSTNGNAVLFVLNLQTGAVIKRLSTGVGSDNGLSEPRGRDIDGNGTVDYVYAGDLKGNLWKFDLTSAASASWNIPGNRPLYRTRTGQAISTGVAIARNPTDGSAWVFFGTGRYLEYADNSDNTVQAMYGVKDLGDAQTVGESELQSRGIAVYRDVANSDRDLRTFEKNAPLPAGKKGWFILLNNPDIGERIIVRPQMRGSILVTSSMVPPTASTCDAGGSGWLNAVDAFTGTATSEAYFDADRNGSFNDGDKLTDALGNLIGVGSVSTGGGAPTKGVFIGNTMFYSKTDGDDGSERTNGGGGAPRRVQWREILQD